HLSFVICHLSFVICHLSFVICHLSFVICHLSFSSSPPSPPLPTPHSHTLIKQTPSVTLHYRVQPCKLLTDS
ncbi:MAG: hypothetical protein V7K27_35595, partial [Nostoc sp.]|uniref:hypothetical protein n=1 Tax=Nostoc sp. TaxID=1180 RepID=UPI002FFA38E4